MPGGGGGQTESRRDAPDGFLQDGLAVDQFAFFTLNKSEQASANVNPASDPVAHSV